MRGAGVVRAGGRGAGRAFDALGVGDGTAEHLIAAADTEHAAAGAVVGEDVDIPAVFAQGGEGSEVNAAGVEKFTGFRAHAEALIVGGRIPGQSAGVEQGALDILDLALGNPEMARGLRL